MQSKILFSIKTKLSLTAIQEIKIIVVNANKLFNILFLDEVLVRRNKCGSCAKSFSSIENLRLHERKHASPTCAHCLTEFATRRQLLQHMNDNHQVENIQQHVNGSEFKCSACCVIFPTSMELDLHTTGRSCSKVYECSFCFQVFYTPKDRQVHQAEHRGKSYLCSLCGKTYKMRDLYNEHMLQHAGTQPHECFKCGKKFGIKSVFDSHMRKHSKVKCHLCSLCGKGFTSPAALKRHSWTHTGEKPHKCATCGKGFTRTSALIVHERRHTGERPFKCQTCGMAFKDQTSCKRHAKYVHSGNRPISCSVCSKGFYDKTHLMNHMSKHTGQKPFMCDMCGKGFLARKSLEKHTEKHFHQLSNPKPQQPRYEPQDKPFPCEVCGKGCSTKRSLTQHMAIHSGRKEHGCNVCSQRFRSVANLTVHMR